MRLADPDCPIGDSNTNFSIDLQSPHISSLFPSEGPKGQWITLNGADFGATAGTVRFIRRSDNTIINGNFPCGPTGWTNTQIIAELPVAAGFNSGDVLEIQIERPDGRNGNFGTFTVNNTPLGPGVCAISKSCGEVNTIFDISGKRFGTVKEKVIFKNNNR